MSNQRVLFIAPAQSATRVFPELRDAGVDVGIADTLKGAISFIRKSPPTLILSRANLPGYRVAELLNLAAEEEFPPIIVFSERPTPEDAERCLELGARDYWVEPLESAKILAALPREKKEIPVPPHSTLGGNTPAPSPRIVGSHSSIGRVLALAKQVASSKATVLISGESGTGKEMFARFLHSNSDRADKPFVAVNCAALPEHLLESELFGHEKGSFTGAIARKLGKFEMANTGTILLDEISEMELGLQAKLLRVLQESELDRVGGTETIKIDVRVLATTNRQLEDWVKEGKFRQDLYFRLNVIPLRLPSLKERGDDMLNLARFFLDLYTREYKLKRVELSPEALKWIKNHDWPGNVRELQNLMERSALLSGGQAITPAHFLLDSDTWPIFSEDNETFDDNAFASLDYEENDKVQEPENSVNYSANAGIDNANNTAAGVIPLHEMERIMIMKGLAQTQGNRTQAADILGISVRTLRNKLNEYRSNGIPID
ncbi:sigma-54-dependent transcriptional regulator [Desulfovibrio litoralis]|uniref:DNA-binding transcriptional response regulator, NtrC family, contains REC, AAA-type ATPase, and a Fis-type DNA-binding domains n=1 Tax=Desulfovibrio litoralis DSM 11393 TaxID=1121455 RepID=A0A1M7TAK3_9BACT|nr:sigma-54 dependent transcriptional regulator [Desulfovibrio litoralis]SHN67687.1 DNA-binding transcriptional response regulator, NtrC family, contains REC, AAA-type ATPase, and a Fis-type DNA-binding domains [Desulfovibrio litoralis DSM 11393]